MCPRDSPALRGLPSSGRTEIEILIDERLIDERLIDERLIDERLID
jgi:hypothetical protein